MLLAIKAMTIKAFLVVYLSTGGYIELEHQSGRTAADVAECKEQANELYAETFGTKAAFDKAFLDIRRMVAEAVGPEAANEVEIIKIVGVCVDMDVRNGTGGPV